MNSALLALTTLLCGATVVGAVITVYAARRAPDGVETEDGFEVLTPARVASERTDGARLRGFESAA